jgi:hypothetical protein
MSNHSFVPHSEDLEIKSTIFEKSKVIIAFTIIEEATGHLAFIVIVRVIILY